MPIQPINPTLTGTNVPDCLAILANTLVKAAFAFGYGSPLLRREVMITLGVTALSAIACCFFL